MGRDASTNEHLAHAGTWAVRWVWWPVGWVCALLALLAGCGAHPHVVVAGLAINEVMSNNDAAWVDEAGQVDDWVELTNNSSSTLDLASYQLREVGGRSFDLPAQPLAAGAKLVLFCDGDPEQGPLHADFKLSAEGTTLELFDRARQQVVDRVTVPALAFNNSYARFPDGTGSFGVCRYASPERDNGQACSPPERAEPPQTESWPAYVWPDAFGAPDGPLALSELALKPARFIEIVNVSASAVALRDYRLRVSALAAGSAWPGVEQGAPLALSDDETLAPGERSVVAVDDSALRELAADPAFEGVVTLFDAAGGAVDRVDFMRWPEGAVLARSEDAGRRLRYCQHASAGEPNHDCEPLASRDVGDRVRHLYTPGDYAALAQGETSLALTGVKVIVDLAAGGAVHFLGSRAWALHYTFIREQIDNAAPLDRCDAVQGQTFYQGWVDFSNREYFRSQGRRYLLATLDSYPGSGLHTLDFAVGDQIEAQQMLQAFFTVAQHMDSEPLARWALHASEPRQTTELQMLRGQAPIVAADAPFRNLQYQPLTQAVAYGTLRFVPATELEQASLGPDVVVVTDAVPNDIPFVGGLITEAFQTPLAHVNVLSQNRGTPNMALPNARRDARVQPLLGKLVRLEVSSSGFTLEPASAEEVDAFHESRAPAGPRVTPRLDTTLRGPVDFAGRGLLDLPSIGAKAAGLAELGRVRSVNADCLGKVPLPAQPFVIPVVHSLEHFEQSGARALLMAAQDSPEFRADPKRRAQVLAQVRAAILAAPVAPELLAEVESTIATRFGNKRLRFRSSSNTEDLQGFNGAGLYESWGGALHDSARPIADAMRSVWASLWNERAYDEREYGQIDQLGVAMGILVHPAFLSERANVIAISRNVLEPTRSDIHYLNAQIGEASVANPAPGVVTEELIHHWRVIPDSPELEYLSTSSLARGSHVLGLKDARTISCYLSAIHDHFRAQLDPAHENRWFAMDVEIKLVGDARDVVFKQARPYAFSRRDRPTDCREY